MVGTGHEAPSGRAEEGRAGMGRPSSFAGPLVQGKIAELRELQAWICRAGSLGVRWASFLPVEVVRIREYGERRAKT